MKFSWMVLYVPGAMGARHYGEPTAIPGGICGDLGIRTKFPTEKRKSSWIP